MKKHYLVKTLCNYSLLSIALSACVSVSHVECIDCAVTPNQYSRNYICPDANTYNGKVVGDGHCVSLIKQCSGAANTDQWRPGQRVWQNDIPSGTIIATFKNGRYPSRTGYHAAIYIKQDSSGIWVWDQWQGKAVHKRLIRWRNDNAQESNSAQSYRTVLKPNF